MLFNQSDHMENHNVSLLGYIHTGYECGIQCRVLFIATDGNDQGQFSIFCSFSPDVNILRPLYTERKRFCFDVCHFRFCFHFFVYGP